MSNASTALETAAPAPAMSFDAWEELGPMGRVRSVGHNTFDHSPRDDNDYPGSDQEKAQREKTAHVKLLFRHTLSNPGRERDFSEHEAGHALLAHYRRTLLKRDAKALELFNALARTANEALNDANQTNFRGHYTVVAPTQAEAEVARKMMNWALTIAPPDTALHAQQISFNPASLPSVEDLRKALDAARPPLFSARPDRRKTVGLIASLGAEQAAVAWAKSQDKSLSYVPGRNRELWNGLINEDKGPDGSGGHYRVRLEFEKAPEGKKLAGGAVQRDNEKVVNAADQVVVFWNGVDDDAALTAAAFAARHGKLYAAFDQDGRKLDADQLAEHAMKLNLSRAEFARSRNASVFDIPAASPEGRLGLSMLRLPAIAQAAVAATPYTLSDIATMAKDPDGAKKLHEEHKIAPATLRTFADDKIVSDARENLMRVLSHCKDHGVSIVTSDMFPQALTAGKCGQTVLFVKAKDPAALKAVHKTAALLGDHALFPHMMRSAAQLVTSLDRPGVTLVQVEDQGVPRYAPEQPSVLVLSTGHGQYGARGGVEWEVDSGSKEIRGAGQAAAYSIRMDGGKVVVSETAPGGQDGAARVLKEFTLANYKNMTADEAKSLAVRQAKNAAFEADDAQVQAPLKAFREQIVERGGFVVSPYPPIETSSVYDGLHRTRASLPSTRTDETRGKAVDLAARMADAIVVTQISDRSPALKLVPIAAELGRPVIALTPPKELRNLPEVSGNIALLGVSGKDLPGHLGISGTARSAIAQAYGDKRAATAASANMDAVAEKITGMLGGEAKLRRAAGAERG